MSGLLLGIDLGTGGCKVSVIATNGAVAYEISREYETLHPAPGWAEQRPKDWVDTAFHCLRQVCVSLDPAEIKAIGVTAPTHNFVLLDRDDEVLRNAIIWTDGRSAAQAQWLAERHGEEIFRTAWHVPSPTWSLVQLMWLQEFEPEVMARLRTLLFEKDYLRFRLCGAKCTDRIDAQGSLLVDMATGAWSPRLVELAGLDLSVLPELRGPSDVVGAISREAAQLTGLRAGTPVIAGASDTAIECFGVGAVAAGAAVVKLATAGAICVFDTEPRPSARSLTYGHVRQGLWYQCLSTNSAAHSLRWYRDTFRSEGVQAYERIDAEAQSAPVGSEGLIYHPYLMGERSPHWNPDLRASFTGIRASHDRRHFSRAIMEGVAFSMRDCLDAVPGGVMPSELCIIGGGARSALWSGIVAQVLNRPLHRVATDLAAFGAALLAGVGIGLFDGLHDAVALAVRRVDEFAPDDRLVEQYSHLLSIYREIQAQLAGTYGRLARSRHRRNCRTRGDVSWSQ